jgi:hypothetical protein
MKLFPLITSFLCCVVSAQAQPDKVALTGVDLSAPGAANARTSDPLCAGWTFHLGDVPGAEKPGFDDAKWRALDVPHDWSIELPYDPNMPGGSAVAYPKLKGKKPMIGTENATSFITRGSYAFDLVNNRGPKLKIQNIKNNTECTGYGKFWGDDRTEGTLIEMRKSPWVAGQFAWTGFDYLGECFPFKWPARNGLFGIVDVAGFPKDSYYIYQADWTDEPTTHIVPQNWNWPQFIAPIPVWLKQGDHLKP